MPSKTNPPAAIVTGASQGIGRAVALALSQMDYRVGLLSRSKDKLSKVSEEMLSHPGYTASADPVILEADVSNENAVKAAIGSFVEQAGRVDILFNNAGIVHYGTGHLSPEDYRSLVNTNLLGPFYCMHAVLPIMESQGSGYIMNLSSRAGKVARAVVGGYASTKFGLCGLNEALFNEYVNKGIRVTAICPGFVATPITKNVPGLPQEKMIQTNDIVEVVKCLLKLSPNAAIKEVVVDCQPYLEGVQ
ncbi:MAG TPA: NAD(P)-dependent oxidoreductase [Opitutae bacterium]|nr:NAD(P)-dependent oxidoreductase [Opitutae bacterium]|tara:strand:- start:78 stop:818 length:741 start_codon:yes stop_codon:yes gene_type:complete